jgi:Ricin-type beta-trefoil lectin domain
MRSGERGSIALALLLTLIGVALSSLLVPVVLTQIGSSREDIQRVHALHAAEAGLDVALAHIRAANDGSGGGVIGLLPCGPLSGRVGAGGGARYEVTIDYFLTDPRGQSDAWITANRITCIASGGTFTTPAYALLRSNGTDVPTGSITSVPHRFLYATYTFQTTNQNLIGGLIHIFKTTTGTDLCLDAGSGSPAAGTNLQTQPCDAASAQQKFAYASNLNLVLVSSQVPSMPLGMCLDAGSPHVEDALVKFQPCATTTIPQQQWSINDSANFEGTADGITLDGSCFNVQTPNSAGSFVILGTVGKGSCRRGYDNIEAFSPEASVGAGAAGSGSGQLVNFSQFGRCMDVTEQSVSSNFLIVWPCKQAPDPSYVAWNQKWALPAITTGSSATGRITTQPSSTYCLQSPGTTTAGQYVVVEPCPSGSTPLNMTWTVFGNTGTYETSYRIKDGYGYCLSPTDPNDEPPDFYSKGSEISKVVVEPCSGSTLQKWNAPPNILQTLPLKDIGER